LVEDLRAAFVEGQDGRGTLDFLSLVKPRAHAHCSFDHRKAIAKPSLQITRSRAASDPLGSCERQLPRGGIDQSSYPKFPARPGLRDQRQRSQISTKPLASRDCSVNSFCHTLVRRAKIALEWPARIDGGEELCTLLHYLREAFSTRLSRHFVNLWRGRELARLLPKL